MSEPGDAYEKEADRIADQVMQKKLAPCSCGGTCPKCTAEEKYLAQRMTTRASSGSGLSVSENFVSELGLGQPLDRPTRAFFEPRFGYDFSDVRVHTSSQAAESARSVGALAYTLGHNIVFGNRQYQPGTERGNRLLAHELAHAVQQASITSIRRRRLSGVNREQEEEVLAKGGAARTQQLMRAPATGGASMTPLLEGSPRLTLQRKPEDETLEETSQKITERSAEKVWSETSPGITEEEKPGERFLLMNFAIREAVPKKEHEEFIRNTVYFGTLTSDPMAKIVIIGHADSTGSKSFNDRLARKRAQEAEKALRRMGKHSLRIVTVTGKGANEPLAQNNSVFGRAKNRRVEILVTPWKPEKPLPQLLTELQKGMKPFVVKVDNFAACPFQDTVKSIVEDAFKTIPTIQFDWEGKSASPEAFISFDDTSTFSTALGLSGDIFMNSFRNNKICKTPGDDTTCEKVFPETADVMGRAIANTVAHETGHAFALDHVPATENYMWSPELHPLNAKTNKTFDEKVVLQRTLQSVPETFNASQLVHMVNRIKEKRKKKPGVVEFE
jgi:outer membrane protein OmpA-like peptidoglycan-associated protein